MKAIPLILTILTSVQAAAVGRIQPANMIRCATATPQLCDVQRQTALGKGCITPAEFDYLTQVGGMPTCYSHDNSFMAWCPCGCFAPGTAIRVRSPESGEVMPIEELVAGVMNRQPVSVVSLDESARVNSIALRSLEIRNVSVGPEKSPMVDIRTEKSQIALTSLHPVLLADGTIARAESLTPGQSLLSSTGIPEKITSVGRSFHQGLVYNLNVESNVDAEHVVIANGLLMGDLYLQGNLTYFENQILVRQ